MFVREAHYQPLTQLSFTSDEAFLFSGGEDAVVHVWRMLDLVDFNLRSEETNPVQSWNEHELPITGIICTGGSSMTARLYTSSLDQTVKVCAFLILQANIDMGHKYSIAAKHNRLSKRSNLFYHRSSRTCSVCWTVRIHCSPIQSHPIYPRTIQICS